MLSVSQQHNQHQNIASGKSHGPILSNHPLYQPPLSMILDSRLQKRSSQQYNNHQMSKPSATTGPGHLQQVFVVPPHQIP